MRYAVLAIVLLAVTGCATDTNAHAADVGPSTEDVDLVDPTGDWSITLVWGPGTCGLTGSVPASIIVTRSPAGYVVGDTAANVHVHGTVTCSEESCQMSFTEAGPVLDGSVIRSTAVSADLTVDTERVINGTGGVTYQFVDTSTCSQQFRAVGALR